MCSPFDLKDYFFGELNAEERELVERHAGSCAPCQEELAALQATRSAVLCLRDEEPPRRIAFVSDKVFEPRWWQKILASGPQVGFASAAMLTMAIIFHALQTPSVTPASTPASPVAQVDQQVVRAVVEKAVAEAESRQADRFLQVLNERIAQSDRRYEMDLRTVAEYLDRLDKRRGVTRTAAYETTGAAQ